MSQDPDWVELQQEWDNLFKVRLPGIRINRPSAPSSSDLVPPSDMQPRPDEVAVLEPELPVEHAVSNFPADQSLETADKADHMRKLLAHFGDQLSSFIVPESDSAQETVIESSNIAVVEPSSGVEEVRAEEPIPVQDVVDSSHALVSEVPILEIPEDCLHPEGPVEDFPPTPVQEDTPVQELLPGSSEGLPMTEILHYTSEPSQTSYVDEMGKPLTELEMVRRNILKGQHPYPIGSMPLDALGDNLGIPLNHRGDIPFDQNQKNVQWGADQVEGRSHHFSDLLSRAPGEEVPVLADERSQALGSSSSSNSSSSSGEEEDDDEDDENEGVIIGSLSEEVIGEEMPVIVKSEGNNDEDDMRVVEDFVEGLVRECEEVAVGGEILEDLGGVVEFDDMGAMGEMVEEVPGGLLTLREFMAEVEDASVPPLPLTAGDRRKLRVHALATRALWELYWLRIRRDITEGVFLVKLQDHRPGKISLSLVGVDVAAVWWSHGGHKGMVPLTSVLKIEYGIDSGCYKQLQSERFGRKSAQHLVLPWNCFRLITTERSIDLYADLSGEAKVVPTPDGRRKLVPNDTGKKSGKNEEDGSRMLEANSEDVQKFLCGLSYKLIDSGYTSVAGLVRSVSQFKLKRAVMKHKYLATRSLRGAA